MQAFLVDGTYELFRAFYGSPPQTNSTGIEIGATISFTRSMLGLIRGQNVTHIGCAFDHVIESFRNEIFPAYKSSNGIDPLILAQFDWVERAAQACGIPIWPMVEVEADDALATAAARLREDRRVGQVVICTPDKDLAQCVRGNRVICLNRRAQNFMNEQGVKEKFGVLPASIPDWLALVGDSADGIPGIPGWGAKSSSRILAYYRHLEKIPDYASSWDVSVRGADRLSVNLRQQREDAILYRMLATLREDSAIDCSVEDLEWRGVPRDLFEKLVSDLEEPELLEAVPRWA